MTLTFYAVKWCLLETLISVECSNCLQLSFHYSHRTCPTGMRSLLTSYEYTRWSRKIKPLSDCHSCTKYWLSQYSFIGTLCSKLTVIEQRHQHTSNAFVPSEILMFVLNTNISQGSVAKHLRCGGIFNDHFIQCKLSAECDSDWILKVGHRVTSLQLFSTVKFPDSCRIHSHVQLFHVYQTFGHLADNICQSWETR